MKDGVKRVAVNGTELGYSILGAGQDKPPLVFTHGYAMRSTGELYKELLELLAPRYTIHAVDLRGHGASAGAIAGWSFEALADDLVAFSRALKLDRPIFTGHSFGAVIGLLAEIRQPGAFSSICLLSPGPADHRRNPVETLDFLIEHGHDRDKLRDPFGEMFARPPGKKLDLILDAVTLVDAEVHRAQRQQDPHFSIDDKLKDVRVPTLLISGRRDSVVPPAKNHDMGGKLQRSKEVIFSAEGHMMAIESASTAAREVFAFLDPAGPMPSMRPS